MCFTAASWFWRNSPRLILDRHRIAWHCHTLCSASPIAWCFLMPAAFSNAPWQQPAKFSKAVSTKQRVFYSFHALKVQNPQLRISSTLEGWQAVPHEYKWLQVTPDRFLSQCTRVSAPEVSFRLAASFSFPEPTPFRTQKEMKEQSYTSTHSCYIYRAGHHTKKKKKKKKTQLLSHELLALLLRGLAPQVFNRKKESGTCI